MYYLENKVEIMKVIPVNKLYKIDYNLSFLAYIRQPWDVNRVFSCFNRPKKQCAFLLLDGVDGEYVSKDGKKILAKSGELVYTPTGSEYTLRFYNHTGNKCTYLINIHLFDDIDEQIVISDTIKVFQLKNNSNVYSLFEKIKLVEASNKATIIQKKMLIFEFLHSLATESLRKIKVSIIQKGIEYLDLNYTKIDSLSCLAKECNISDAYFRQIFKKQFGITPCTYRNNLRMEKAKQYLEYSDTSISEISELLGFSTVSHFIKQFKSYYNTTPLQYRTLTQS